MAIVKTFDLQDFIAEFRAYGRKQYFSDQALEIIFDYLNDLEEAVEINVVSICCDFLEQSAFELINSYYDVIEITPDADKEECKEAVMEFLNDQTVVLGEYQADDNGETVFVFLNF